MVEGRGVVQGKLQVTSYKFLNRRGGGLEKAENREGKVTDRHHDGHHLSDVTSDGQNVTARLMTSQ